METLKAKMGPFPLWVWLALITALGLTYYLYERHKNPSAGSTANAPGAGQVPQIVEQTSVTVPQSETTTTNVTVPPEAPEPKAPPVPHHPPPPVRKRPPGDNERREKDNPADVAEDKREPGEEAPEPRPATHHGQHRHQAPPRRHVPPRRPGGAVTTPERRVA